MKTAQTSSSLGDGGAAFPAQPLGPDGLPMAEGQIGMSLRDWFAGQALSAGPVIKLDGNIETPDGLAGWAYEVADAMLKERAAQSQATAKQER